MEGATTMIQTCLANVSTVVSEAIDVVTANEVGALFIGIGIICAGIGVAKRIMH